MEHKNLKQGNYSIKQMKSGRHSISPFITVLLLSLLLISVNLSAADESPWESKKCYERDWMTRANFIKNYIATIKENGRKIGLSGDQIKKLEEILELCTKTCIKGNKEIDETRENLKKILLAIDEKSDKKIIIEQIKKMYSLKAKVELAHFQLFGKAEDILSEEQKINLKEIPRPAFQ